MIGIVPAGGRATRIHGIPKYLLPTTQGTLLDVLIGRIERILPREIVIMSGGINTAILNARVMENVRVVDKHDTSMAHAVMLAQDYNEPIDPAYFGMPDAYFDDADAFRKLAAALSGGADVAVGLFKARPNQHNGGMCRVDGSQVVEVIDKPEHTDLTWIWGVLAWKPIFWQYMDAADLHVGFALPRAVAAGLDVRAVIMDGGYWDCGTTEDYFALINYLTEKVSI